ncbi:FAD-binding protein [Oribacterium sp. P6A1]|uniref:FAD-binding protein n=1 Tax=Oribacterium sp. P6A1 TaxID=1410612 RepID=UPI00055EED3E|nr:FAD-binding protein [Oribacterium sp. P6A1]
MKEISRRSFIKGGLAAVAAMGVTVACGPQVPPAESHPESENGKETATGAPAESLAPESAAEGKPAEFETLLYDEAEASKEEETDVVVVGIGVAGTTAAAGAADKGCKVIALDRASGFGGTNNVNTTGAWHIESSEQLKYDGYLTKQEAFEHIMSGTNYQCNARLVRNMLEVSGRAIDIVINSGMPMIYPFAMGATDWLSRGGHVYMVEGLERVPYLEKIFEVRPNVELRWNTQVTNLLKDGDAIVGVLTGDKDGNTVKIRAKSVIVCTGGFLQNKEMVAKYYGGAELVPQDSIYNDGEGIRLLQNAGAQMGKNFSISMNEMGAANFKATPTFSWAPGRGTNATFYFPNFGLMLVNRAGDRFMDERRMCEATMYSGEQALRESTYYTIVDQAFMDKISTTPVIDFLGEGAKANMGMALLAGFEGVVLDHIYDDFEEAVSQNWAYKADTVEELAEHFNMPNLVKTVETYNAACESGVDDQMYTPKEYLIPVKTGPFYMVEYNVGAWLTLGGIKTDGNLAALTSDGRAIPNLYVCGADADLWSTPYYQGGSGLGFCYASGLLAGESAAANAGM